MRLFTRIAYAAPAIGLAGLSLPLQVFLPNFYATQVGIPLTTVGLCFLAIRLIDIAFDPVAGLLMDRTATRAGRFRPWLAGATMPLMLFTWALFNPPPDSGPVRLAVVLAGLYAAWSICFVAQLGWGVSLARDYRGRNAVFAWWQGFYLLGSLLVTAVPVAAGAGGGGIAAMGWFVIVAVPIGVALALTIVPDASAPLVRRPTLARCANLVARPDIARLLAIDLLLGVAVMLGGSLFFFYFAARHGIDRAGATTLFFLLNLGSFAGVWLWAWLGSRVGKHRAGIIAFVAYALLLVFLHLAPIGSVARAAPLTLLFGATIPAGPILIRSMLGDAGDAEQLRSGHDHKGLIAALFATSSKLGTALGPGIGFVGLGLAGFDPAAPSQTAGARAMLYLLAIGVPAMLGLAATWLVAGHRITEQRHRAIVDALSRAS